jgi:hypothetical protein
MVYQSSLSGRSEIYVQDFPCVTRKMASFYGVRRRSVVAQ